MSDLVYTIGHSTHSAERLISLLAGHQVTAVADVRSRPYSRMNPQFNRENLRTSLKAAGIAYVFLGHELGARPEDRGCYVDGKVQYDRLARTALFHEGLRRIAQGLNRHRIAMMCAEKDPLACHRSILVSRHLVDRGIPVQHILEDGALESHGDMISRLLVALALPEQDLFRPRDEVIAEAYMRRGEQIAYTERDHSNAELVQGADR